MLKINKYIPISILLLIYGCSSSSTQLFVGEKNDPIFKSSNNIKYYNYWEAMSNLDFDYLGPNKINDEYLRFAEGLKKVKSNDLNSAENIFRELLFSSSDSLIIKNSKDILTSILFSESKWNNIIELDNKYANPDDSDKTILNLSRSFLTQEKERYFFPPVPTVLPFTLSSSGSPIIPIKINDKTYNFWLDTGAGLSVLASNVAEDCGIRSLSSELSLAGTGTSKKVNIKPIVVDKLEIGDVVINNHPSIIIDESDLKFKLFGIFTIVKIDGIIGWNAIKNIVIEIDYTKKEIVFSKPMKKEISDRNFFWLDNPVVSLNSDKGIPLLFRLDTGANVSGVSENIFSKINAQNFESESKTIGSAGGFESVETKVIPDLTIILGNNSLNYKNITSHKTKNNSFLYTDGVLGSDILKDAMITIDYLNGRFDYKYVKNYLNNQ